MYICSRVNMSGCCRITIIIIYSNFPLKIFCKLSMLGRDQQFHSASCCQQPIFAVSLNDMQHMEVWNTVKDGCNTIIYWEPDRCNVNLDLSQFGMGHSKILTCQTFTHQYLRLFEGPCNFQILNFRQPYELCSMIPILLCYLTTIPALIDQKRRGVVWVQNKVWLFLTKFSW